MATRLQNIMRVRALLDNPYPNAPDFHTILQQQLSTEADILNVTNNTGRPWAVSTYQLNYYPGQTSYPINVSDFGKAYLVTRIIPGPYIRRINVPFTDLNEQKYGSIWPWYGYGTGPWSIESTVERMSFYREGVTDSNYLVTIEPQPQDSCVYEITYVPGVVSGEDPLQTATQLPEHATLAQLRVAMATVAYARWYEEEEQNRIRRKELAASFDYQLNRRPGGKEEIFERYVASIAIPKIVEIGSWDGDGVYGGV